MRSFILFRSSCWPPTSPSQRRQPRKNCAGLSDFMTKTRQVASLYILPTLRASSLGTIDCKEMMDIVGNLYEMEGFSKVTTRLGIQQNGRTGYHDSCRTPLTRKRPQSSACWTETMTESWMRTSLSGAVSVTKGCGPFSTAAQMQANRIIDLNFRFFICQSRIDFLNYIQYYVNRFFNEFSLKTIYVNTFFGWQGSLSLCS